MKLIQGSTYDLGVELTDSAGNPIDVEQVEAIEFSIGDIIKTYAEDIPYADGILTVSLSQEDTFLLGGKTPYQVRVKYKNGNVDATYRMFVSIEMSVSEVVL